ncbi:hypothetical protein M8542_19315 [Amycolatopsis sp. OK19-0408]|uniref:Uncharacterized protein n=1 Tax=Amycolatopsis iheyensis TaxID=2945988 RepID=A0A9X2NCV9_9PSEU|nr:hypothetical protein [Amycolatopsis iheyensis]MCR6484983.1 hypothetical protein [Amycolatopsis iheyensis]
MNDVVLRVDAADPDLLDDATTALYEDLRDLGDVRVGRVEEAAEPGAKSGLGTALGDLVLSGGTVAAVYRVIVAWLGRSKARSVTWVQGEDKVELTALSGADQRRVIELIVEKHQAVAEHRAAEDTPEK